MSIPSDVGKDEGQKDKLKAGSGLPMARLPKGQHIPGGSVVKNLPAKKKKRICLPMQEKHKTWVSSLDWEDLLEKGMATHSSILAWEIS